MEARPLGQPGPDLGVLVGAGVVHDQVHVLTLRNRLCRSGAGSPGIPGAGGVADVVMSDALQVAQAHGRQGLRPVQGLDLRLLVDAEHHPLVQRIQIEADDVPELFDKEGIGGELERLLPVWLDREALQPAVNGGFGDALQLLHVVVAEDQRWDRTTKRHGTPRGDSTRSGRYFRDGTLAMGGICPPPRGSQVEVIGAGPDARARRSAPGIR